MTCRNPLPFLFSTVATLASVGPIQAQTRASELQMLAQEVSGTTIRIEYYRPSMRGREVLFGGQIYWGEVWTPGANWATKLAVSKDFEFGGLEVSAGVYGVWSEEDVDEIRADPRITPETLEEFDGFLESMRVPRPVEFRYDEETGELTVGISLATCARAKGEARARTPPCATRDGFEFEDQPPGPSS